MAKKISDNIYDYIYISIGSLLTALAINLFLLPNKIAAGGVSGLATVLHYLFGFPVGRVMLIINIPLFIIGFYKVGGSFGFRTLFSTVLLSILIDYTSFLPAITYDSFLASIYGGAISGVGLFFVFKNSATTGGTDLAAKILHSFFPNLTVGQILLLIDAMVIIFAGIAFKNQELMLYAIVTIFITTQVIDILLEGVNYTKVAFIITDKPEIISKEILYTLERGVTGLFGKGLYTNNDKLVLLCVIKRNEIPHLKKIVKQLDENSFIILTDAKEVLGEGFQN